MPDQQNSSNHAGDEVMSSPPTLDPGAVHDEDGLSDGEGAVVPDYEEHEQQVHHPVVEEVVGGGQDTTCRHNTSSASSI